MKVRDVLFRKCIGCNEIKKRINLIRICRTTSNDINIDLTYKMEGRGAYLCNDSLSCLEKSIKFNRISRALKVEIPLKKITELQEKMIEIYNIGR